MSILQSCGQVGHASSINQAFGSNNGSGNSIIVGVAWDSLTDNVSVSDSQGNTYTSLLGPTRHSSASVSTQWFIAQGIHAGANTVTVTDLSGAQYLQFIAIEDDALASSPFDKSAVNAGAGTSISSGATPATTQATELVLGLGANESGTWTITPTGGYSLVRNVNDAPNGQAIFMVSLEVTSTGAQTATATSSASFSWGMDCITLKRTGGGGGGGGSAQPVVCIMQ